MRMEIEIAIVMLVAQRVIHVVKHKLQVLATLIGEHNLHARFEWHRDVAVEAPAFRAGKQCRLECRHVPKP
jgi:hypothetical protein